MGDNAVRCPKCEKSLGGLTRDGDVRVRLAITLVKGDGTVHGPCGHCGEDVIVSSGGAPTERVQKALTPGAYPTTTGEHPARRRLVIDLRDFRELTPSDTPR